MGTQIIYNTFVGQVTACYSLGFLAVINHFLMVSRC